MNQAPKLKNLINFLILLTAFTIVIWGTSTHDQSTVNKYAAETEAEALSLTDSNDQTCYAQSVSASSEASDNLNAPISDSGLQEENMPSIQDDTACDPDEVCLPDYDIPIKLGMNTEEFFEVFSCDKIQGNKEFYCYDLSEAQDVKVVFKDDTLYGILISNPFVLLHIKNVIGSFAEDAVDRIGQPYDTYAETEERIFYAYDSSGQLCGLTYRDVRTVICIYYTDGYVTQLAVISADPEDPVDNSTFDTLLVV